MIDKFVTNKIAELTIEGEKYSLPIIEGTEGEKAIDIRKLRQETGYITLDSGYMNTGSCTSEITYLEGSKGILNYRGYAIEDLAENCSFVEVAYLLLHGHLPTADEYQHFSNLLGRFALIHEDMIHFFDHFPPNTAPMAILSSMVNSRLKILTSWPRASSPRCVPLPPLPTRNPWAGLWCIRAMIFPTAPTFLI
jgi:citrate synthase